MWKQSQVIQKQDVFLILNQLVTLLFALVIDSCLNATFYLKNGKTITAKTMFFFFLINYLINKKLLVPLQLSRTARHLNSEK
jgi:hypothetical protein